MKKIIYFGWIAPSSLNAILNTLEVLVKKRIKVYYIGFEYSRKSIESIGGIFIPYLDFSRIENPYLESLEKFNLNIKSEEELVEYLSLINKYKYKTHEIIADSLIEIIEKISPNYIFRDLEAIVGKILGEQIGVKTVSVTTTVMTEENLYYNDLINKINLTKGIKINGTVKDKSIKYKEIIKKLKVKAKSNKIKFINPINDYYGDDYINIGFGNKPMITLKESFKNRIFQPSLRKFKQSDMDNEINKFINSDKKLIYVGTGSGVINPKYVYNKIVNTLDKEKYNILISIPNNTVRQQLPSNVIIRDFIPQQEVLKKVDLFVTAGGYNSICEAIYNEVPMLVLPIMNDQFLNGYLVQKGEIGRTIALDDFKEEKFMELVEDLISDKKYKKNLNKAKNLSLGLNKIEEKIEEILLDLEVN